jgi:hypothetical protein
MLQGDWGRSVHRRLLLCAMIMDRVLWGASLLEAFFPSTTGLWRIMRRSPRLGADVVRPPRDCEE